MSDWSHIRDEIKERLRLSEIVGRKVSWDRRKSTPSRGEFWACCPFHNEKTSSFHVLDREGFYKCFGCGAGGDVVNFVMETENRSYREAMEMLAEEAGVDLPKPSRQAHEAAERRASLHEVLEKACAFFEGALRAPGGQIARDYLKRRGLSGEIAKTFRLGYWPDGGHALIDHLKAAGIDHTQMRAAGLLSSREGEPRDLMRHRLIFPITDGRGRIIAFGGRALREGQEPKYLNSPDTDLFHKRATLYNFARARTRPKDLGGQKPEIGNRPSSAELRHLIVAEGYMDVIALARAHFRAVAPLGTALTEDQLQLLWSVEEAPVICFDGDAAGLAAAGRALDRAMPLLKPGGTLRFAFLPPGRDPDDLLREEGPSALAAVIEAARPLAEAYWDHAVAACDLQTPDGRAHAEAELLEGVKRIADPSLRRHYEAYVRGRISEWFQTRRRGFAPGAAPARPSGGRRGDAMRPRTVAPSAELRARAGGKGTERRLAEEILVLSLLTHPEVVHDLAEEVAAAHLTSAPLKALAAEILRLTLVEGADAKALIVGLEAKGLGGEVRRLKARQGLKCLPSTDPKAEAEVVVAALHEVIGRIGARHEAEEVQSALRSALGAELSEEAWAEARALAEVRARAKDAS